MTELNINEEIIIGEGTIGSMHLKAYIEDFIDWTPPLVPSRKFLDGVMSTAGMYRGKAREKIYYFDNFVLDSLKSSAHTKAYTDKIDGVETLKKLVTVDTWIKEQRELLANREDK